MFRRMNRSCKYFNDVIDVFKETCEDAQPLNTALEDHFNTIIENVYTMLKRAAKILEAKAKEVATAIANELAGVAVALAIAMAAAVT